jgi:hypothetical protein
MTLSMPHEPSLILSLILLSLAPVPLGLLPEHPHPSTTPRLNSAFVEASAQGLRPSQPSVRREIHGALSI